MIEDRRSDTDVLRIVNGYRGNRAIPEPV